MISAIRVSTLFTAAFVIGAFSITASDSAANPSSVIEARSSVGPERKPICPHCEHIEAIGTRKILGPERKPICPHCEHIEAIGTRKVLGPERKPICPHCEHIEAIGTRKVLGPQQSKALSTYRAKRKRKCPKGKTKTLDLNASM